MMQTKRIKNFILIFVLFIAVVAQAQERIITSSKMVGLGNTDILDTYLSQERYKGYGLSFLAITDYHTVGQKTTTTIQHQVNVSKANDRSHSNSMLEGKYDLFIGKYYNIPPFINHLSLYAGLLGNVGIGGIYNTTAGNNPAQARLHINVMPSARAYYKFFISHTQCGISYEIDLPLTGIMFSPNYQQSYYEIFSRGNYDHNIVATSFINAPTFRQQLIFHVNVSARLTLKAGYLGHYEQAEVNQIKRHIWTNRFMLGFVHCFSINHYRP